MRCAGCSRDVERVFSTIKSLLVSKGLIRPVVDFIVEFAYPSAHKLSVVLIPPCLSMSYMPTMDSEALSMDIQNGHPILSATLCRECMLRGLCYCQASTGYIHHHPQTFRLFLDIGVNFQGGKMAHLWRSTVYESVKLTGKSSAGSLILGLDMVS